MKIRRLHECPSVAWKNGGGVTQEMIREPAAGAGLDWRLSVAWIDRPGPFSDFSGYQRTMVLLEGGGIRLSGAGVRELRLQNPGDLIGFDGALALQCHLLNGPCRDLNLMVADRLGAAAARVERVSARRRLQVPPETTLLLFCVAGNVALNFGDAQSAELQKWDAAVAGAGDSGVELRSACAADGTAPGGAMVFIAAIGGRPDPDRPPTLR